MERRSRREFFKLTGLGLAGAGIGSLALPADAGPTPASGNLHDYPGILDASEGLADDVQPTEDNILGPYHRRGTPFRAKITPPLEPGRTLLIRGIVWGADTRKPLPHATLDIWQADEQGRYDNDDRRHPPRKGIYKNRARLIADENGYYEFETILPGRYQTAPNTWRPRHIHYLVRCNGYRTLVTQLYFKGDKYNGTDPFIKRSLIITPKSIRRGKRSYDLGRFDIVLAKK